MTRARKSKAVAVLVLAALLMSCSTVEDYSEQLDQVRVPKAHGELAVQAVLEWWATLPADAEGNVSLRDLLYSAPALVNGIRRNFQDAADGEPDTPET